MPAEGTRKLTDKQRAEIALLKDVRPTSTSTNKNIADQFDVSEDLINRISYEKLTQEQKDIYNQQKADLKYHASDLTFKSIIRAKEMLRLPSTKLSEVMGAAKIGNDIFRLEEGLATSIVQQTRPPIEIALEYADKYLRYLETQGIAGDDAMALLGEKLADNDVLERVGVGKAVREEAILRLAEKSA